MPNVGSFVTLNGDRVASGPKEIPSSDPARHARGRPDVARKQDRLDRANSEEEEEGERREKDERRAGNSSVFSFWLREESELARAARDGKVKTSWRTAGRR